MDPFEGLPGHDTILQGLEIWSTAGRPFRGDVRAMIDRKLVDPEKALELFRAIEPRLYLFPAIDPSSFRRTVEEGLSPG